MLSPLKKSKSNEEDINQSLREIIYKKVTKKYITVKAQTVSEMGLSKNA